MLHTIPALLGTCCLFALILLPAALFCGWLVNSFSLAYLADAIQRVGDHA